MAYKRRVTPFVLQNDSLFDAYRHVYYYKKGTEEDVFRCVREMDAVRDSIFYTGVGFIRRHISSPVAVYVAKGLNVRAHERRVAREVAGLFPEEFRKTPEGQKLEKAVLGQPLYVGDVLPDFEVLTTGLKKVKLSGILRKGHYTLVELWASWCGPCQMQSPVVDAVAESMGDQVKVCKVNVDEQPQLALNYQIVSIPTLVFMKDGMFQKKMIGLQTQDAIEDYLKTLLDA